MALWLTGLLACVAQRLHSQSPNIFGILSISLLIFSLLQQRFHSIALWLYGYMALWLYGLWLYGSMALWPV